MTVRELIKKLLEQYSHDLDEEIKLCLMSHTDEEASIYFRISEVDENRIYFRERGVTSEKKIFKVKLPLDESFINAMNRLTEINIKEKQWT